MKNNWSYLLKIIDDVTAMNKTYTEYDGKKITWSGMAKMLIGQYNTASGSMIESEVKDFVRRFHKEVKSIIN